MQCNIIQQSAVLDNHVQKPQAVLSIEFVLRHHFCLWECAKKFTANIRHLLWPSIWQLILLWKAPSHPQRLPSPHIHTVFRFIFLYSFSSVKQQRSHPLFPLLHIFQSHTLYLWNLYSHSWIFIKTCNNTVCSFSVHSCLSVWNKKWEYSDSSYTGLWKNNLWVEKDILFYIDSTSSSGLPSKLNPIMVLSIPQPTLQPPREAAWETWHYLHSNFTSTKATAARKRAHWILFINKVIHKWWVLSSVCEQDAGGGWTMEVKDGLSPCIPLRSDGLQTDAERVFAPMEEGGLRDWALSLGAAEPVSVAVWSGLIKAGAASGSVALNTGSGLGETHRATVPWVGFLSAWMTCMHPLLLLLLLLLNRNKCLV